MMFLHFHLTVHVILDCWNNFFFALKVLLLHIHFQFSMRCMRMKLTTLYTRSLVRCKINIEIWIPVCSAKSPREKGRNMNRFILMAYVNYLTFNSHLNTLWQLGMMEEGNKRDQNISSIWMIEWNKFKIAFIVVVSIVPLPKLWSWNVVIALLGQRLHWWLLQTCDGTSKAGCHMCIWTNHIVNFVEVDEHCSSLDIVLG